MIQLQVHSSFGSVIHKSVHLYSLNINHPIEYFVLILALLKQIEMLKWLAKKVGY